MSRNINQSTSKDILAQWVFLSLRKALSKSNIRMGFEATGIWLLNHHAVDSLLAPSEMFTSQPQEGATASGSLGACGVLEKDDKHDGEQGHVD
jgi:hypothetical protein